MNADDGRIKILHVEDDLDFVRMLGVALGDDRINLISAQTVDIARHKLEHDDISLVLLDVGLPGDSGLVLIEYIEAMEKSVPIIILSADDPSENVDDRVLSVLVKSRISEQVIVDTILNAVGHVNKGGRV